MLRVFLQSWPLLTGVLLLMVGNGVQGSLLGIRGTLEAFNTLQLSVVMSAYFLGFLIGSRLAPQMIRSVGHVRVFAALASLISAVLVLYPMLVEWQIWAIMRVIIGFGFAGIYITAESWLNNTATNETRGQSLSLYMMVQMLGIVASQALLSAGDPFGYDMFLIPSVLVSLSFLPILLAKTPAPTFETTERLGFGELFRISPLGCVGMLISGGIFSAMFGMAAVWGTLSLFSVGQIALFTSALYIGGLILQYPVGYLSDRMDRRSIMLWLSVVASVVLLIASIFILPYWSLLIVAVVIGGVTYPMYSLLIAYTNDFLSKEQMAAASAGLIFLNGFGAIFGPLITGWLMGVVGTRGFFLFMFVLYAAMVAYTIWRMSRRAAPSSTGSYRGVTPTASTVAAVAVLEAAPDIGPSPPGPGEEAEAEAQAGSDSDATTAASADVDAEAEGQGSETAAADQAKPDL